MFWLATDKAAHSQLPYHISSLMPYACMGGWLTDYWQIYCRRYSWPHQRERRRGEEEEGSANVILGRVGNARFHRERMKARIKGKSHKIIHCSLQELNCSSIILRHYLHTAENKLKSRMKKMVQENDYLYHVEECKGRPQWSFQNILRIAFRENAILVVFHNINLSEPSNLAFWVDR